MSAAARIADGAAAGPDEKPCAVNGDAGADGITGQESAPFDPKNRADAAFWRDLQAAIPKMQGAAACLGRGHAEREDLVQGALEKCIRHRRSFTPGTNIAAWACFVLRNIFYSDMRRAWRSVQMADGQAEAVPAASNVHARLELAEVLDALQYLPAEHVDALLMISEGISYDQAAEELGIATGTVKSRVSRAREALGLFFSA